MKMSKDSSTDYYQNNKERLQRKALERRKSHSKEEKEKRDNMVASNTKIYQKMKNKNFLSIEKNNVKLEETPSYNYKKLLF